MTIVASNSLTLSNVNDGTITHTAYSYSADGKDGFTTVYPNLNLLDGTKDFSGVWWSHDEWETDGTYKGLTVKKRIWQWQGISKPFTAQKDGVYTFSAYVKGSGSTATIYRFVNCWDINGHEKWLALNMLMGNSFDWLRDSFTVNLKTGDTLNPRYEISGAGTDSIVWTAGHKWEHGSIATPYMPSESEVKTSDWPSYIGQYTDFTQVDSTNPSDYTWSLFKGQDSNAYTAYSWSSDGAERFTTVYPNLNLLEGSNSNDKSWLLGGNGACTGQYVPFNSGYKYTFTYTRASTDWAVYMFSGLQKDKFKPDTDYVLSFMANVSTDIKPGVLFANAPAQHNFVNQLNNPTILSSKGDQKVVIQLRTSSSIPSESDQQLYINGFVNKVGTFSIWDLKIEPGSTATPWTPSQSESQDQWQDAIPMYVGVGDKDSQNPSDYRWQLNPRYVQASSDSGLSNKAGLDDLASVANTANDALVQAQNAVSNEDYTSWLEHDYQTTIDNLQDISTQNQKDINNVDDRTTIVEGFYDEMKVKWNFIDESFTFSEEGMFISNAQSKMAIQVTSDKIVFWDNNVDVAFITGEVLNIQKGVFLESATIGNHLITKFSDDSPVTIIRYVGGIT